MINKVILCGNLCRDPEVKVTDNNNKLARFTIAVNNGKRNGQPVAPDYFNIEVWDGERVKTASFVDSYLRKGTKVCIEGRLKLKTWENQNGKQSAVYILGENIEIMSSDRTERKEQFQQDTLMGGGRSMTGGIDDNFRSVSMDELKTDNLPFY